MDSEVNDCPMCGLVNPQRATQCDCGYDFAKLSMPQSKNGERLYRSPHFDHRMNARSTD